MRRWIGFIVIAIVVFVVAAIAFAYSGIYNVAATQRDMGPVAWLLGETADHSIRRRARDIKVPPLDDPQMTRRGFAHYRESCAGCHGAPGVPAEEIIKGFNPSPPRLPDAVDEWKPNELFWITKNGIRMTGMPTWGVAESDVELWQIVAFMRKLPTLTPAEYRQFGRQTD